MRAIVHKTKGKLDLRSITTFGLNAKPNSDTPIGYFGTGLKYALAVLARENIPVSIYIDGKKWEIQKFGTKFRGKDVTSLALVHKTKILARIKDLELPFTTDLGKNWEIWQAFRELECNTRDEKGETFTSSDEVSSPDRSVDQKGYTCFVIQDERYVQEYLNRDQHFLKDGLTVQTTTDRLQVFPIKSKYMYYRGVRICDLKEESINTYNFLCQIDLTEDRTAKSPFMLGYEIEQFLGSQTEDPLIITRAITAPKQTYEHRLGYEYAPKGDLFLDTIESNGEDATPTVRSVLRASRPPERPKDVSVIWQQRLIDAIKRGDGDAAWAVIDTHRTSCIQLLERDAAQSEKERINNDGNIGLAQTDAGQTSNERGESQDAYGTREDDDIPF